MIRQFLCRYRTIEGAKLRLCFALSGKREGPLDQADYWGLKDAAERYELAKFGTERRPEPRPPMGFFQ